MTKILTAYGISPYHSNAMKSSNPYSGIYEAQTSKCLDLMGGCNPNCNQGGIAIVERTVKNRGEDKKTRRQEDKNESSVSTEHPTTKEEMLCSTSKYGKTFHQRSLRGDQTLCAVGCDMYNHTITGDKTMTLNAARVDPHKIPTVIEVRHGARSDTD